ncbi:MAG: hypothetical protein MUC78_12330, partial [Bacteroidales bacterium]|nr:hypothetical protein [Bacteroidales bacterium]
MEGLLLYLMKSAVWITGFAFVFMLFLQNERYFSLNRIYLISGIVTSLIFPFITIRYVIELPAGQGGHLSALPAGGAEVPSGTGHGIAEI